MNDWLNIALVVLLLLLNAFFVGAEFTLISSRRDRLEALLEQGKTRAKIVINASKHVSLMLAGAQLGITICSLLLGRLGEPAVAHRLSAFFDLLGLPEALLHPISFAIALAFITVLHVLIGEMVPKNLAIAEPERLALWLVPVHVGWVKIANPFIWLLNFVANSLLRAVKVEPKDELETAYTSDELAELLSESRREGLLDQSEHRRLAQTLSSVAEDGGRRAGADGRADHAAVRADRRRRRAGGLLDRLLAVPGVHRRRAADRLHPRQGRPRPGRARTRRRSCRDRRRGR